jgi:hypothetical protein
MTAAAIMTAPVGWLVARFGRKRLFIVCIPGFTIASMLFGAAQRGSEQGRGFATGSTLARVLARLCLVCFTRLTWRALRASPGASPHASRTGNAGASRAMLAAITEGTDMAKGLLFMAFDFSTTHEDEFHDWYDREHVPERLRVPGFLNAERWIDEENPKIHVATYDLDGSGVLTSPAYKAVGGENQTAWTKRVTGMCRRIMRYEGDSFCPAT